MDFNFLTFTAGKIKNKRKLRNCYNLYVSVSLRIYNSDREWCVTLGINYFFKCHLLFELQQEV